MGKSFRNEVTPGQFIFRTREFEQMEMQYFVHPDTAEDYFDKWVKYCHQWLLRVGVSDTFLRLDEHEPEKLAHYSKQTTDIEFEFPFGWGEVRPFCAVHLHCVRVLVLACHVGGACSCCGSQCDTSRATAVVICYEWVCGWRFTCHCHMPLCQINLPRQP